MLHLYKSQVQQRWTDHRYIDSIQNRLRGLVGEILISRSATSFLTGATLQSYRCFHDKGSSGHSILQLQIFTDITRYANSMQSNHSHFFSVSFGHSKYSYFVEETPCTCFVEQSNLDRFESSVNPQPFFSSSSSSSYPITVSSIHITYLTNHKSVTMTAILSKSPSLHQMKISIKN